MKLRILRPLILLILLNLLLVSCEDAQQIAENDPLKHFYGTFKGTGETMAKDEVANRDLTVIIQPWEKKGFNVEWKTTIYREGREKKTNMSINFYQSPRPGIYASAMDKDVFGNTVAYNPANKNDNPYVWAGLDDKTLTISALYITDRGGYEIQVYKRTLEENGLALEFERLKNGKRIAQISSQLKLVKD